MRLSTRRLFLFVQASNKLTPLSATLVIVYTVSVFIIVLSVFITISQNNETTSQSSVYFTHTEIRGTLTTLQTFASDL